MANTFLITRNGIPEETLIAKNPSGGGLSVSLCDIGSTTYGLSHKTTDSINRTKGLGKAESTKDSFVSTAISDELAKIYNHIEHCRNTDCLHVKPFFLIIESSLLVSDSVLYTSNTVADTCILQKTHYRETRRGLNKHKEKANKAA